MESPRDSNFTFPCCSHYRSRMMPAQRDVQLPFTTVTEISPCIHPPVPLGTLTSFKLSFYVSQPVSSAELLAL